MKAWLCLSALLALPTAVLAAEVASLPPPASRPVDFIKDIQPILDKKCVQCHGRGHDKGGFRLDTRDLFLGESDGGVSVLPGRSADSYLIRLVAGVEPENIMPQKGTPLTPDQVGLLRAWIDQGAPWPTEITFVKQPPRNLHPVVVELPPLRAKENPIDALLRSYFLENAVRPGRPVDDGVFARRVTLDLHGLLPEPTALESFVKDRTTTKRARYAQALLSDDTRYADNWLTFWNDLLRNDYRGTGYIDGGRKQISAWLYAALLTNKPYSEFVTELVHPNEETRGFAMGILWRGEINASQLPPIQAAQNISQVFMGVNLKCASCHDSFIDDWKLSDAYGLAAVYADGPLELVECDKPLGKVAKLGFIYPELGTIPASTNKADRTEGLARLLTGEQNGRLSKTIVNRLWQRFFGRGLVEPVDVMEEPAFHTPLLDWLAADLVAHDYDLRHTMLRIVTSQAYQMEAVKEAPDEKAFVFRGPLVRRMNAEQFVDAISQLTGVWQEKPMGAFDLSTNHLESLQGRTRASLVAADPLMTALDRPNREQVVTVRQSAPTTLQALELTNGKTLAELLRKGGRQLSQDAAMAEGRQLADLIYRQAFGRRPSWTERRLSVSLLGQKPTPQTIEDFLWAIIMQPEFQLIY